MDPAGSATPLEARATLVRQYELLLTARHSLALRGLVAALHDVAKALQLADLELGAVDGVERVAAPLRQLAAQCPVFLGDTQLLAFVRALRESTRGAHATLKAAVGPGSPHDDQALVASVVDPLEHGLVELELEIARALPIVTAMRRQREQLVELVDAACAVVDGVGSVRTAKCEKEKAVLLGRLRGALDDPPMRELRQVEAEIRGIQDAIRKLLTRHVEICRPITAAKAQVTEDPEFDRKAREDIMAVLGVLSQLETSPEGLRSVLVEANTFIRRLRMFEKAAAQDAFMIFSSALKLNFSESLDEELFLAYVVDWRDKEKQREAILAAKPYQETSQRIAALKEDIVRAQAAIQASRKHVALDAHSTTMLVEQITDAFREAGGDIAQIVEILK